NVILPVLRGPVMRIVAGRTCHLLRRLEETLALQEPVRLESRQISGRAVSRCVRLISMTFGALPDVRFRVVVQKQWFHLTGPAGAGRFDMFFARAVATFAADVR